jgi:hypothetical protein
VAGSIRRPTTQTLTHKTGTNLPFTGAAAEGVCVLFGRNGGERFCAHSYVVTDRSQTRESGQEDFASHTVQYIPQ